MKLSKLGKLQELAEELVYIGIIFGACLVLQVLLLGQSL